MEFRDALKALRRELNITQVELAAVLHINVSTVSRWELGKALPNPAAVSLLLGYAYTRAVSKESIAQLRKTSAEASKRRQKDFKGDSLLSVEHSSLSLLIEQAPYPIYVCDFKTDKMLYANRKALEMIGLSADEVSGFRCFECIMNRSAPCETCHKDRLPEGTFIVFDGKRPGDDTRFLVYGGLIRWNGRDAQVRYVLPAT